jgi:glycosyltransferase involved in cell wall biosynthesis
LKKNLMLVTHDLAIGGLQQVVVNICRTINTDMFNVSVVCLRDTGPFAQEINELGIKVHVIPPKKGGVDYLSFIKLARLFQTESVEIIHTHNTQPFVDGTLAALMSGVKTIVHTDHARDFPDKYRYMAAEWIMSQFAYKVVGVSDHTAHNLIHYEKISPRKILVIPNGIDGSRFMIHVDSDRKKKSLGITNKGPILGLGVRLSEEKGVLYLLRAMPEIIGVFPDISLVIAGAGPSENELKQQTATLGINNHVLFIGPRLDIPEILQIFDLYVLPSTREGLPMVLLEAMAAGCPIVATDVGGNATAISHRFNGSLIKPKDPVALAQEIILVLSDQQLRRQYIHKSKEVFQNCFSAQTMTRAYERLYLREH